MSILNISTKKRATFSHNIIMICLILLITIFSIKSQAKAIFDLTFKSHNSDLNNNLGVLVMDDNEQKVTHDDVVNSGSKKVNTRSVAEKGTTVYSNGMLKHHEKTSKTFSMSTQDNEHLVYVNGMFTDLRGAISNLLAVKTVVARDNVQLAFNDSEDFMVQLAEVAAQHFKQQNNLTTRQSWFETAMHYISPHRRGFSSIEHIIAEYSTSDYINDVDLNRHINSIYLPLLEDEKVVVVLAHSQGNFYANRAWDTISQLPNGEDLTNALGIVGVANPASNISGSLPDELLYTTNHSDKIILAIKHGLLISPLPSNIDIPTGSLELGHALEEVYFKNNTARNKIVNDVNKMFDRLEPATKITCTDLPYWQMPPGSDYSTFYTPGVNYKGNLNYHFSSYNGFRDRLIISGTNIPNQILVDKTVARASDTINSSFYYDWSIHGQLSIRTINLQNKPQDYYYMDIYCP